MKIEKFQEGGAAPAPAEGGNPMEAIVSGAAAAVEANDGQMALQVCQALLGLVQQAQSQAPQGAPVFKAGGVISRYSK